MNSLSFFVLIVRQPKGILLRARKPGRLRSRFRPEHVRTFDSGYVLFAYYLVKSIFSGIITQFICDTLVNNCGASTAAHNLCVATEAAVGAGKNDGAKADKFNLAFGTVTHFADAVGSIPSGSTVAVTAAASAAATTAAASSVAQAAATGKRLLSPCSYLKPRKIRTDLHI